MRKVISLVLVGLVGGSLYGLLQISKARQNAAFVREIPLATSQASEYSEYKDTNRAPSSVDRSFTINDELLSHLESNREHLAEYAHAEPSAGGWRIHLVAGEPLFAKAGFHDGQFISFEMLKSISEGSRQPQIADRMVDILRSIEQ